jgi:phosphohistidine swiveling domain-containing protein
MLGEYYSKMMVPQIGVDFDDPVIISRKGFSYCYIRTEARNDFSLRQIERHMKDGSASGFCQILKDKTDHIISFLRRLKSEETLKKEEFEKLISLFYGYLEYYITPRQVIDYMDYELVTKTFNDLKEARIYIEPFFGILEDTLIHILKKIGRIESLNYEYLSCLLVGELQYYLNTGKLPDEKILKKRFEACALVYIDRRCICITDMETIDGLEKIDLHQTDANHLKGTAAFKGKAQGTARIVYDPLKHQIFNEGDVLITGMTRPDYLPLMKKSSAIITDVGGLLCHAAIVAREIGKPCIIGTKFATKVLKDGDYIEVDANNGIVKKINSK